MAPPWWLMAGGDRTWARGPRVRNRPPPEYLPKHYEEGVTAGGGPRTPRGPCTGLSSRLSRVPLPSRVSGSARRSGSCPRPLRRRHSRLLANVPETPTGAPGAPRDPRRRSALPRSRGRTGGGTCLFPPWAHSRASLIRPSPGSVRRQRALARRSGNAAPGERGARHPRTRERADLRVTAPCTRKCLEHTEQRARRPHRDSAGCIVRCCWRFGRDRAPRFARSSQ